MKPDKEQSPIPVSPDSRRLNNVRRVNPVQKSKKNLQGTYKSLPEGAEIVNTSGTMITIKTPGQQETVISKSNIAIQEGERKEAKATINPRLNFLRNKEELVQRVQDHKHEIVKNMTVEKLTRSRETTAPDKDLAVENLAKVSSIRIPENK